jgi:predicted nucleic acid-binding Zn ribbon protein
MPLYLYQNTETEEVIEVLQGMNDKHEYFDAEGKEWKRVFTVPTASIDTKINPFSSNDFVNKTSNKKGTVGDMMDLSSELSQKRADQTGSEDPVKRKLFTDYEKKVGKKHLMDKKTSFETAKVKVEL